MCRGTEQSCIAVGVLCPAGAAAQTSDTMEPPRTVWGDPDLQGVWDYSNITPMQRPKEYADRGFVTEEGALGDTELPHVQVPVLQFHGLLDTAVDKDGLNRTRDRIAADYTLVTSPEVGHDVQLDAADRVTETMRSWLGSH